MNLQPISDIAAWSPVNTCGVKEPDEGVLERLAEGPCLRIETKTEKSGIYGWQSPLVELEAGDYYRFSFRWRSTCRAFWEAQFPSDSPSAPPDVHTSGMPVTGYRWEELEYFFRAKHGRRQARVLIWPLGRGMMDFMDFASPSLTRAAKADAWAWFSGIMASVPPIAPNEDDRKSLHLVETRGKLRAGRQVTIAVYGDSIGYDVGNSPIDLALEDAYPGCRVAVQTRGLAGSGWEKLSKPELLAERILSLKPDLLLTLSISNQPGHVAQYLPVIVDSVREACGSEFMFLTDHLPADEFGERYDIVAEETREVARRKECQLVDTRVELQRYLRVNGLPFEWLLRDRCHFNERGRAVVLQILMQHLGP